LRFTPKDEALLPAPHISDAPETIDYCKKTQTAAKSFAKWAEKTRTRGVIERQVT